MFIDDTPERTKQYWIAQNPDYIKALDDPRYQAERERILSLRTHEENNMVWKQKLNQLDPSHPKAPVPDWVRWAKRDKQQFRCYVLGWHETDWMRNKLSGSIQQIGILTLDHTLAAANGGLTTDANTMMIAEAVNQKKGSKVKTYEEMRAHFYSIYELYIPTVEEIIAINSFREKGINKVNL
jgi:hypothetical protein